MKYSQLIVGDQTLKSPHEIEEKLKTLNFHWIIDSEFEKADIEIVHNTVVWKSGDWFHGIWEYGIWTGGKFHGTWRNGIWEGGTFDGEWGSGIDFTNTIKPEEKM